MEIALGDLAKPQLESYNPADALSYNNMVKNREQRDQLAATNEKMAKMHADMQRLLADLDGDGVSDYFDKCAGTSSGTKVDGLGCPLTVPAPVRNIIIITEEDRRIVAEAIRNLEFGFNKASIRPSSLSSLNRVADLLIAKI
jgi:OmpA-OmpF porin, OOP family